MHAAHSGRGRGKGSGGRKAVKISHQLKLKLFLAVGQGGGSGRCGRQQRDALICSACFDITFACIFRFLCPLCQIKKEIKMNIFSGLRGGGESGAGGVRMHLHVKSFALCAFYFPQPPLCHFRPPRSLRRHAFC